MRFGVLKETWKKKNNSRVGCGLGVFMDIVVEEEEEDGDSPELGPHGRVRVEPTR